MTDKELNDRIDAWLDGKIEGDSLEELNRWLVESPENADRFAERSLMHGHLFDWAEGKRLQILPSTLPEKPKSRSASKRWKTLLPIAAVLLLLLAIVPKILAPRPGDPVATLVNSPGADLRIYKRSVDLEQSVLRSGEYTLSAGLVSIAYESGVKLLVEAPASFRLNTTETVTLHHGQVSAHVPPEGIGFTIDTPSAEVIDYGTEFAVDVGINGNSEVHVFQGEVEVQPRVEKSEPVRLLANAATRVELESRVPLGIDIDKSRFLRSLEEGPQRHSHAVMALEPALYYRMGVPKDGVSMRDKAGSSDGTVVDRGSQRPPFAPGRVGSSMRFDGPQKGAYLRVADYPKPQDGQLSLSCWVKAESLARRGTIASNADLRLNGQFEMGLLRDSGKVSIRVMSEGSHELVELESESQLPRNEWQHLAFVADGKTLRFFLNGELVNSVACGPISTQANHASLGIGARLNQSNNTGDRFWHGRIDEFALFNHSLSEDDVRLLFQNSEPVK